MAGDFPDITPSTVSSWPEVNVTDPVSRGGYAPYSITLTFAAVVVFATRVWLHTKRIRNDLGLDDLLSGIACLFGLLFSAVTIAGTLKFGFSNHIWDVPLHLRNTSALIAWLSQGAFIISVSFTKISVLCFMRRVERPHIKPLRLIIYVSIAFTTAFTLGSLLTQVLLCRPTSDYWRIPDPEHPFERSCTSQHIYYPIHGALEAFSTFYSILIPVLVLRNVSMTTLQRQGLRLISLGGLVVFATGIARTVYLSRLVDSLNGDATWNTFPVWVCSQAECSIALILASLPFLQPQEPRYPTATVVYVQQANISRKDSVIPRVSSLLSGQIKRLPCARCANASELELPGPRTTRPRPQAMEIPDWQFAAARPVRTTPSPIDEYEYHRYMTGRYGPPAPPKDSRMLFDDYRRERHGNIV